MNYMDLIGVFNENIDNHYSQKYAKSILGQDDESLLRQRQKDNLPVLRAILLKQKFEQNQSKSVPTVIPTKHTFNIIRENHRNEKRATNNLRRINIVKKEENLFDADNESDFGDIDI